MMCFVADASAAGACMRKRVVAASEPKIIAANGDITRVPLVSPTLNSAGETPLNLSDVKPIAETSAKSPDQKLITLNSSGAAGAEEMSLKMADTPAPPQEIKWTLVGGKSIRTQLAQWADVAGWHVDWKIDVDWIVPSSITYIGTFDHALETVIEQLYAQGKPVRLMIWSGNQVAEVVGNDVK